MKISKSVSIKAQKVMYNITAYLDLGANFKNVIARLGNTNMPDQKLYHPLYCTLTIEYIENCLQRSISLAIDSAITITMTKLSIKLILCIDIATTTIAINTATIIQYGR